MATAIFTFSATGNSLSVARKIARELKTADIHLIQKLPESSMVISDEIIGFVFPVYVYGVPRIVRDFIKRIDIKTAKYIFAVATCGGTPGAVLPEFRKLLKSKGVKLHSGFALREKTAVLGMTNPVIGFIRSIAGKMPSPTQEQLPVIIETIQRQQSNQLFTSSFGANLIGGTLHKIADSMLKKGDQTYWTDDNCNLCEICIRICPRNNIYIDDNKIKWKHNCEQCFACLHWCPKESIQIGEVTKGKPRYHNSDVTLNDFMLR